MKMTVIGHWGAYPAKGEATSCYLIEEGDTKLILDCGSGAVSNLQNHLALKHLDGVIVSHTHADHVADLGVLAYSRLIDMQLNHTHHRLNVYAHEDEETLHSELNKDPYSECYPFVETDELEFPDVTVQFCKGKHKVDSYGMKIISRETGKKMVYTADTSYTDQMAAFAKEADLLLAECSFYQGQNGEQFGHMTSLDAGRLASRGEVGELILTHLPHFGDHAQLIEETRKVYVGRVSLASAGMSKTI
ncbi:beta-lactamase domain protein [[Bacillus] selenitireducens MLS10]|uniref:Beta-lactamase domain protein n=2 Tax=Salisediminibacterium selenitireducens TaxID=85683 RepID=D6XT41_BACIE|nr:beta-lactamase domain protein [[Bacillus] selenitireducens MLS10]